MMNGSGDTVTKERLGVKGSAEEQPQHHIPQRISSQGIASWCSSNIPNEERRRKKKWVWGHYSTLFLSVGPTAAPWQVEEGTLFSFERGRACQVIKKKKKNGRKNHLQNRLRCRPYGSEFNKDKRHLLTAACSLGLSASPAFFFFFL